MADGDVLVHLDYDLTITDDASALFCLGQNAERGVALIHFPCWTDRQWSKAELVRALNATDAMLDTAQVYGGVVVLRKTPFAVQFLREWLQVATDPDRDLSEDVPCRRHDPPGCEQRARRPPGCECAEWATPQDPAFREHRHDQFPTYPVPEPSRTRPSASIGTTSSLPTSYPNPVAPGFPRASARPIDRLAPRQAARPQDLPDAHRLARPALALVVGRGILRGGVAARDVARRGEVLAAGLLAQGKDDVAGRRPPLRPDGDAARLDPRLRGDRPPAHAHGLPRRPGGNCAAGGGRRDAQAAARRAQPPRRARVQPRLVPREPGDAGVADGKVRGGRLVRLHGLDPTRAERRAPRRRGLDLWRMPRPLPVRQQRHRAAVRHARVAVQTDVPVPVRDADRRGAAGGASRSAKELNRQRQGASRRTTVAGFVYFSCAKEF
mmetsp:Transcript_48437/g.155747  ORF Transcript_48437/g.155747 Transcript_48437/m.155747 type:complete len:438 (+) Transcript_48437:89-1402(+)